MEKLSYKGSSFSVPSKQKLYCSQLKGVLPQSVKGVSPPVKGGGSSPRQVKGSPASVKGWSCPSQPRELLVVFPKYIQGCCFQPGPRHQINLKITGFPNNQAIGVPGLYTCTVHSFCLPWELYLDKWNLHSQYQISETDSHHVAQAGLALATWAGCFCLLGAGIVSTPPCLASL